jgi:hypothetical protein
MRCVAAGLGPLRGYLHGNDGASGLRVVLSCGRAVCLKDLLYSLCCPSGPPPRPGGACACTARRLTCTQCPACRLLTADCF